jgi:hypothetical protein
MQILITNKGKMNIGDIGASVLHFSFDPRTWHCGKAVLDSKLNADQSLYLLPDCLCVKVLWNYHLNYL